MTKPFAPDETPTDVRKIAELSYQYQREWRFDREKRLMQHALTLFPNWQYALARMEWHSRPEFHLNPEKSKVQPRKPLHLPRDERYIPKQETMDSLCFVTASGSDQPYFNLSIQLLESIKATRWYNHIPIKVLDCGLTQEDADYLRQHFGCEVKDPGWDSGVDIQQKSKLKIGMKGCTARPYIAKHFPGYEYYFWLDTDTWVQDERILDRMICLTEEQGLYATRDLENIWTPRKDFSAAIPHWCLDIMLNKKVILNSAYCITAELSKKFELICDRAIQEVGVYRWGFDMAMLNCLFYKEIPNGYIDPSDAWHYIKLMMFFGARFDAGQNLYTFSNELVGIVNLSGWLKSAPRHMLFSYGDRFKYYAMRLSMRLNAVQFYDSESLYQTQITNNWQHGTAFYRTYLNPEDVYGPMEGVL